MGRRANRGSSTRPASEITSAWRSPDDLQGAGEAVLARQLGLRSRLRPLRRRRYGSALSRGFRAAAAPPRVDRGRGRPSGIRRPAVTPGSWRTSPARSARGVLLAGFGSEAGGLIRALRGRFGSHLTMIAGDGFLPIPDTLKGAGPAADGIYVSLPGAVTQSLTPAGRRLLAAFEETRAGGPVPSGTYLPETLEAAEIVVDAIARSDGTRASVLDEIRRSRTTSGVFGGFDFDRNGDMTPAPFAILRITGGRGAPGLAPDFRGAVRRPHGSGADQPPRQGPRAQIGLKTSGPGRRARVVDPLAQPSCRLRDGVLPRARGVFVASTRGVVDKLIRCECGYEARAAHEDELVA